MFGCGAAGEGARRGGRRRAVAARLVQADEDERCESRHECGERGVVDEAYDGERHGQDEVQLHYGEKLRVREGEGHTRDLVRLVEAHRTVGELLVDARDDGRRHGEPAFLEAHRDGADETREGAVDEIGRVPAQVLELAGLEAAEHLDRVLPRVVRLGRPDAEDARRQPPLGARAAEGGRRLVLRLEDSESLALDL